MSKNTQETGMGNSNAALRAGYAVFVAAALVGCGGGAADEATATDTAVEASAQACDAAPGGCTGGDSDRSRGNRPKSCDQMVGLTVPTKEIGLPTRGAAVTAASLVPAAGTGARVIPEHCLVSG